MKSKNRSPGCIKVGQELSVTITAIGAHGDGIANEKGYVIIVKSQDLQIEDQVLVKITKVLPRFAFAELANQPMASENNE